MSNKILVSDSKFLECVDEIATQITEMNFGEETYREVNTEGTRMLEFCFTEEAQDFYNEKFDEYETLINNTLNVWNKQREHQKTIRIMSTEYKTCDRCCYDIVDDDGDIMEHICIDDNFYSKPIEL